MQTNKNYARSKEVQGVVRQTVKDWALDERSRSPSDMRLTLEANGFTGLPVVRTFERWADKARTEDPEWSPSDTGDVAEFQIAGRLTRWLTVRTESEEDPWRRTWPTRDEVRKVKWVHERAPEMPLEWAWQVARHYIDNERNRLDTRPLDYQVLFGVPPAGLPVKDDKPVSWYEEYNRLTRLNKIPSTFVNVGPAKSRRKKESEDDSE